MHSFLGYGLMAGRAGIFAVGNKLNGEDGAESCIPHGATVEFSYLDKKVSIICMVIVAKYPRVTYQVHAPSNSQ